MINFENISASSSETTRNNKMMQCNLQDIVEYMQLDTELSQSIYTLRNINDPEQASNYKKEKLPYFCLGKFRTGSDGYMIRNNANFISTNNMIFDFDKLNVQDLNFLKEKIKQDNEAILSFTSPSGNGLKVIYTLEKTIDNVEEYKYNYKKQSEIIAQKYGYIPDKATCDVARATYFSYDPDMYKYHQL